MPEGVIITYLGGSLDELGEGVTEQFLILFIEFLPG